MRLRSGPIPRCLLAAITAAAIAGCSASSGHSSTSTTSSATTSAVSSATAARAFAAAYVRYLRGDGAAATLPDITSAARQSVTGAGPLPARGQPARLRLTSTSARSGGLWTIAMRDGAHELDASFSLARQAAGWRVTMLIPPDFSTQLLAAASAPRRHLAAGAAAPAAAARVFLSGYLPFEYGHVTLSGIRDLTPRLHRYLKRNTPRLVAPLHPRVLAFAIHRAGRTWVATPSVSDGVNTYQVTVTLVRHGGRWLANTVPPPNQSARSTPEGAQPTSTQASALELPQGGGARGMQE